VTPYYQDEWATLYHGDCRDLLPSLEADVLVTDPPYGIAHKSNRDGSAPWKGKRSIAGDDSTAFRDWVLAWWGEARPALVFGKWRVPYPAGTRMVLVWDKGDAGSGDLSIPWKPSHEQIYVLGSGFHGHRGPGVLRHIIHTHYTQGRYHPHEKPVELMQGLIQKCPSGVVLDPFAGSGTTLVAAKNLGRAAIGVEVDERHCEQVARRLSQEVLDLGAA
jgi:DNA modification methylase